MAKYEFIKVGKRYLIKNSNGKIVDEKTMLKMKNEELVLEDIKSDGCQGKITKEISKNKKRIKEIEKEENQWSVGIEEDNKVHVRPVKDGKVLDTPVEEVIEETALEDKEVDADDTIEETDTTL